MADDYDALWNYFREKGITFSEPEIEVQLPNGMTISLDVPDELRQPA